MKKLFVLAMMTGFTTAAFAGTGGQHGKTEQCEIQAEHALKNNLRSVASTRLIGLVDSIQLQPGDETFFDKDEVWNSEKIPVVIHLFKLMTNGLTYNAQVTLSIPDCTVLSITNGSID